MSPTELDAVELGILWSRFVSIMEEAQNTLLRLSFSTVIGEARDFACVLLDPNVDVFATARMMVPGFTFTLPHTVHHFLRCYPAASLQPGDVLITNDPWQGSGHLSDVSVASPIFYRGRIVAYVACCAHVADIGGTVGYHTGRDVYEEGLAIPSTKLCEAGLLNELLLQFVRANVRVPDMVVGDIMAMLAALELASQRVAEALEDTGMRDILPFSQAANRCAEKAMRAALADIPDATYHGEYTFDGYEQPLTIKTTVTVNGDEAELDFTGTSPQQRRGAINAPFVMVRGSSMYAFKYMLCPEVPTCSGLFAPIRVTAPEGCLVNCTRPVSVKARSKTSFHIVDSIFRAFEGALPERVQAATGHSTYIIVNGVDDSGCGYNSFYIPGGGMGASAERDGPDCTLFPTNTTITPVEVFENTAPLIIHEKALLADSGGAGRRRGGLGQRLRIRSNSSRPVTITLRPEDRVCPPLGLCGGGPGRASQIRLNGDIFEGDLLDLLPGDVLEVDLPGGGGVGRPALRDPEAIRQDIAEGLMSLETARHVYGLSVDS